MRALLALSMLLLSLSATPGASAASRSLPRTLTCTPKSALGLTRSTLDRQHAAVGPRRLGISLHCIHSRRALALVWRNSAAQGWLAATLPNSRLLVSGRAAHGATLTLAVSRRFLTVTELRRANGGGCRLRVTTVYAWSHGRLAEHSTSADPKCPGRHSGQSGPNKEAGDPPAGGVAFLRPPTLSGQAAVGQTLTCTPGPTTGSVARISYEWQRGTYLNNPPQDIVNSNGHPGSGSSYTVTAADLYSAIRCVVFAEGGGSVNPFIVTPGIASVPLSVAPELPVETIGGANSNGAAVASYARVGCPSAVNGATEEEVTVHILRDGEPIPGITSSYLTTSADAGHSFSCAISAYSNLEVVEDTARAYGSLIGGANLYEEWGPPTPSATVSATSPNSIVVTPCYSDQAPYCQTPTVGQRTSESTISTGFSPEESNYVYLGPAVPSGVFTTVATRDPEETTATVSFEVQIDLTEATTIDLFAGYSTLPEGEGSSVCCEINHYQSFSLTAGHHVLSWSDLAVVDPRAYYAIASICDESTNRCYSQDHLFGSSGQS